MAHGLSQYFPITMASGASVTSDVAFGRGFARVYVNIDGATNSVHFMAAQAVAGSPPTPGSYLLVKYPVLSGLSAPQTVTVGTATSGSFVEVPLGGFQYVKVYNVGGAANGATIKFIGSDC